ncbi:restriction endonuclease [Arcobacter lacus]|uniref:restriction endonuclease n=1 Tax=Arcobacter lacus TaxID=1912876 RepID=UPI0021BB93A2|nr:restriction endonuclease [Arcobacter lacus]MCT7908745.1 restriction endonuclease [Arcobacter lacus]
MKLGTELESYIQYVYEVMLNLKSENILVSKNAMMIGKSSAKHEIDVFYQFEKANVIHKVAIECKDTTAPVSKGKVQEFIAKIQDLTNVIGIMVSRNGYQSGAEDFGKYHGLLMLRTQDLPSIADLLRNQITKFFLPHSDDIGEPFWAIMEIDKDKEINGNYYVLSETTNSYNGVALFFSKYDAELQLSRLPDKSNWAIRGLRQYHLKGIISWSKLYNNYFNIIFMTPSIPNNYKIPIRRIKYDILEKEYLLKK